MSSPEPFVSTAASASGVPELGGGGRVRRHPTTPSQRQKRPRPTAGRRREIGLWPVREPSSSPSSPVRLQQRVQVPESEEVTVTAVEEEDRAWESCRHPTDEAIFQMFGAPSPQNECWACQHGTANTASVNQPRLDGLIRYFTENIGLVPTHRLATGMHEYFERYIRGPANAHLRPDEEPVAEWSCATILEHIQEHSNEPSIAMVNQLEQLRKVQRVAHDSSFRTRPSLHHPGTQEVSVDPVAWKVYREATQEIFRVYKARPKDMFLYNPHLDVSAGRSRPIVNPRRNVYAPGKGIQVERNFLDDQ